MREAVVSVRPKKDADELAAEQDAGEQARAERAVARKSDVPRERVQSQTRTVAIAERTPACSIGGNDAFASLIATCWKPHAAHKATMTMTAVASGARRRERAGVLIGLSWSLQACSRTQRRMHCFGASILPPIAGARERRGRA